MQKTKLGITVGLFGAIIYFMAAFGNSHLLSVLLCGYVLFAEENPWLKKTAIKSVLVMVVFSLLSLFTGLIPNIINIITNIISAFGTYTAWTLVDGLHSALSSAISLIRVVVLVVLGFKAFNQGTIKIPVVDKLVDKYMD